MGSPSSQDQGQTPEPGILCRAPLSDTVVDLACGLVKGSDGHIAVVRDVELPKQTPLSMADEVHPDAEIELEACVAGLVQSGVDAEAITWVGHDAIRNLASAAWDRGAGLILVDVEAEASWADEVDPASLAERAGLPVLEIHPRRPGFDPGSLLVPVVDGPKADVAVRLASLIGHRFGIPVELLHVLPAEADEAQVERGRRLLASRLMWMDDRVEVTTTLALDDDVSEVILERAQDHGALLLGATRRGWLDRLLRGTVPATVQAQAQVDVLLAHGP